MAVVFDAEVAVNNIPVEAEVESNLVDLVPGVDVIIDSGGGGANVQASKSVSYTPSETAISDTVQPDEGYDSMAEVAVSVGAIPDDYVGSAIPQRSSTDMIVNGATVKAPAGYYAEEASKGVASAQHNAPLMSVSGNVVTATHTQSAGYTTGGTTSASATIPVYDGS